MSDRLRVMPQYVLPKQAMTRSRARSRRAARGRVTTAAIRAFVAKYGVDMSEAANPDIASYATFNEFFTRALRPGARPLADAPWICPVDGAISQFGATDRGPDPPGQGPSLRDRRRWSAATTRSPSSSSTAASRRCT